MTQPSCIDPSLIAHAKSTLNRLKARHLTVVTAESCTAGLVSAVLSQVEDASDVLHGSFVTYTKSNKTEALGVDAELLKRRGSVNENVAFQLACGTLDRSPADLALSVTGVLGPSPDEDGNPVGLVFLACRNRHGSTEVEQKRYGAKPPDELRRAVVLDALALLARFADDASSVREPPAPA